MPIGSVPGAPVDAVTGLAVRVTTVDAGVQQDVLRGRPRTLRAFSTGNFTGAAAATFQGLLLDQQTVLRITQIFFQMSENGAISGGAAVVLLQLRQNGIPTGIETMFFVPTTAATGVGVEVVGPWDLVDGIVTEEGSVVDVLATGGTLTSGQFRVVILGYLERRV